MVIIALLYAGLVYLVFFRFKLLPWNKPFQLIALVLGVVILLGFLTGLENLTPTSIQATTATRVVDVAPQVGGQVIRVHVEQDEEVEEGAILFEIDPTLYAAQVKQLEAGLSLARLRLGQLGELTEVEAASKFQLEQTEAEVEQLEAQLTAARFNLENATVRAPGRGRVARQQLRPGIQVSPARSVMTFIGTEEIVVAALVKQKALQNVRLGDRALVSFPALPGRVFETRVASFQSAIAEGQLFPGGQLASVQQRRMVRTFPVWLSLPEDAPSDLHKVGLAARVTIMTERANVVGIVATVLHWLKTSLDIVL
jgi:multidrug resistance efflux pump